MNTKPTDKKALIWLSTAHIINDTYSGFLNPIMPFIAAKIGFSMAVATIIMSIAHVFSSLLQPIFGFFADNIIKRVFIFWGLIMASIFIPICPSATNVYILTSFIIFGSTGGSFFHPQATGFISRFSKENFSLNMGIFMSAGSVGMSFGPLISAFIAQNFGLAEISYTSIVGIVVALAMFSFVPKISKTDAPPEHIKFKKTFKEILSNKSILILTLISMLKTLITNSCLIMLPFLWKNMGYSPTYIGIALFLFIFAGSIGAIMSSKIEKIIGAKKVFYLSLIGTLPIIYIFSLTYQTHPKISLLVFILMGFITMLAMPVNMVMAQRIMPEFKSIIAGFINGFSWGVVAIILTLVGFLAQNFGITKILLLVSFIPAIFSYFVKYLPDKVED